MVETNFQGKETHFWASGPPLHATFYVDHQSVTRIILEQANQFLCTIIGEKLTILEWIEGYLQGKSLPLPLTLLHLSPFMQKGLRAIASIPRGEVRSYGEVAALAGCEKGARAIGNVCNKNPFPLVIPCHRVIQGNGTLGGFAYPLQMKELLLKFEDS
jgi:methylated-DNA-[protein]-cysteine S-methyltransferase